MRNVKRHFATSEDGLPFCGMDSQPRKHRPWYVAVTSNRRKVTCKNCLRIMKGGFKFDVIAVRVAKKFYQGQVENS